MMLRLLLTAAFTPSVLALTEWGQQQKWPVSASCPFLSDLSCGGADGADPVLISMLVDISTSVPIERIREEVTDFHNTFMNEVFCTRYNLPPAKTELWIATWSGKQVGGDYFPVHSTQFEKGPAWDNDGAKIAESLTKLKTFSNNRPDIYTHPASALEEAADYAEATGSTTRNLVVLFTDGEMGATGIDVNGDTYKKVTDSIQTQVDRLKNVPDLDLVTVGIGDKVNVNYLTNLATDNNYVAVSDFSKLGDIIEGLLSKIQCDESGGGALEEAPTNFPTTGPPTVAPPPTTGAPIVTSRDTDSPTRSPIGVDTASPTPSGAAPSAELGVAPLLMLAGCALRQLY